MHKYMYTAPISQTQHLYCCQHTVHCLSITFEPYWQHYLQCSCVVRNVTQTYCACMACRHQQSFSAEHQVPFRHAALAKVLRSSQHNRAHPELAGKHIILFLRLLTRCYFSMVYWSDLCVICGTCAESSWQRTQHSSSQSCLCCAGPHLPLPQ